MGSLLSHPPPPPPAPSYDPNAVYTQVPATSQRPMDVLEPPAQEKGLSGWAFQGLGFRVESYKLTGLQVLGFGVNREPHVYVNPLPYNTKPDTLNP